MFTLPITADPDGQHDDKPIRLPGDSVKEFEALMRIFYPPYDPFQCLAWSDTDLSG